LLKKLMKGIMSDLQVTYMQYWSVGHAIGKVVVIIQSIASSTALMVANTCPLTQTMFAIGISTFRVEKQLSKYLQTVYVVVCCQRASDTQKRRKQDLNRNRPLLLITTPI